MEKSLLAVLAHSGGGVVVCETLSNAGCEGAFSTDAADASNAGKGGIPTGDELVVLSTDTRGASPEASTAATGDVAGANKAVVSTRAEATFPSCAVAVHNAVVSTRAEAIFSSSCGDADHKAVSSTVLATGSETVSSSSSSDATATAAGSGTETISFSSSGSNEFHDELLLAVDVHAGPALAKFLRAVLPERGAGGEGCRQGCDASVMIEGSGTERTDPANLSLGGFNVIDAAKRLLEAVCPVTVSCSDILVLAARDAVTFVSMMALCDFSFLVATIHSKTGGPLVPVSLGRLDGLVSLASNVRANIIDTGFSVDAMARSFSAKGLTLDDLVTLSGTHTHALECWRINCDFHFSPGLTVSTRLSIAGVAHWRAGGHTIGSAHCTTFGERFRVDANGSTVPADAAMNADYAGGLIRACSAVNNTVSSTAAVDCDEGSASRFDNAYFANLLAGRGLLRTDAVLVQNATTRATVEAFARSEGSFFASWAASFARLTSLGVRTGADGEVRRTCSRVNG
uniref:OSJNBa0029H02.5 protein n=1 Tax=Oryza sativa subsp. japonica TaxID=39947 RepID=Q7XT82_ORYSJ|nr:OSJNBa0029H02.5 [Oryza sativa Japonica Group]